MRRILKWAAIAVVVLGLAGFAAFLYFIPPFTVMPPEAFVTMQTDLIPPLTGISDPATKAVAERGRQILLTSDCAGCHFPPGPDNQTPAMYLAGGMKFVTSSHGTVVSRNLTPDRETGIGALTDEELRRTLRSGIRQGGWAMSHHAMPWPLAANWTDEEMHAVLTFLRHIPPVWHEIPPPARERPEDPDVVEVAYGGASAGKKK